MNSLPFFRDLALKGLAITGAVLLWLVVAGDPAAERGLRVPLSFENLPSSMEILGELPETVEVRLRGASGTLRRLDVGDVEVVIDLESERSGSRLFDMTTGRVRAPLGVEVARVIPSTVSLILEFSGEPRVVPVVPVVTGEPAPGFVVDRVIVEPAVVTVVGPVSRLRELAEVITETLDVTDVSVPLESTVTVGVADPNLRLETPQSARVRVEIIPAAVERMLADVPVQAVNMTMRLSLTMTPRSVVVTMRGPSGQARGLDEHTVGASVDLAGLGVGRYNLPVVVEPYRSSEVIHIEPARVEVVLH